jgi:Methylamine utilisation protein MauE
MMDSGLALFIALGGALLFGFAVAHKLREPEIFAATLAEYRVMPFTLVRPAAALVMMAECAVSFALVWPSTRLAAAVAAAVLLLSYAAAIGINLHRGRRDIDCGCTMQPRPIGGWMIVRNVLMAGALLTLALPVSERPLAWLDGATICAALLAATLLYLSADLLLGRAHSRQGYSVNTP